MTDQDRDRDRPDALDVPPEQWVALTIIVACVAAFFIIMRVLDWVGV